MKVTILIIILTCGCIASTYSQINKNRKQDMTADSLSKFHFDVDSALDYKKMIKPNHFRDEKILEPFLSNDSQWISRVPAKTVVQHNMPCYKPKGVFSMRF